MVHGNEFAAEHIEDEAAYLEIGWQQRARLDELDVGAQRGQLIGAGQEVPTAGVDPANRIGVYWKRAVGADSAPVVTDSGDHTTCQIHAFTGVKQSGDPWNITAGGNDSGINDTTANIPGATTTVANTLVVLIEGTSFDHATSGTAECGAATNADIQAN